MSSNCYIETLQNLNACLLQVCPTRRVLEVLLFYDSSWPHVFAHHYNHHKIWLAVMLHPPYCPDLTLSGFLLFGPWKDSLWWLITLCMCVRHCRMFYANGCTGRKATFMWWEYMFLFKGRRRAENIGDYTGKYPCLQQYFWWSCLKFLCVWLESDMKQKKRHYLLTKPCMLLNHFMIRNRIFS